MNKPLRKRVAWRVDNRTLVRHIERLQQIAAASTVYVGWLLKTKWWFSWVRCHDKSDIYNENSLIII